MTTHAPAFSAWLDDFLAAYYRRRPVNATFIGVHDYDDRLPDLSEQGVGDTAAEMATLQRRLNELPDEPLSDAEAMDRILADGFLEIQQWEYASSHFHRGNPSLYAGEAVFGVMALFLRPFAPIEQRVEAAIARLYGVPALLEQGRANVRRAPAAWTERAVRECDGALAFLGEGIDRLVHEHGLAGGRLRAAADSAAAAFGGFRRYLDGEPRARPTEEYGCGAEAFDLLLRRGHCLDEGADSIEARALERMQSSRKALEAGAAALGAHSWPEALDSLADAHPTAAEYLGRFDEVWRAARSAAEHHHLLTWPDYPLRYVLQPDWARAAAPSLYFLPYRAPAPFDDTVPVEYLVPPIDATMSAAEQERRLRATNDSVIKLNHVVHHGGLGHHVQNWHAHRARSRLGQIAAVDCAARIALFCGGTMAEGWACYATDLMDEIGFLTPLERLAEHHTRLRMAARAVVDVRLHHGVFSLDEATAFYRDRVGMEPEAARAEAVKNSMFPGAAAMYLIGTDLIHHLRRDLAAREGAAFDLCRFHDRFLSYGSVPVALIARAMREEVTRAQ